MEKYNLIGGYMAEKMASSTPSVTVDLPQYCVAPTSDVEI